MSKATGIIEGFVAVDPRVNQTNSGKTVANVTVAHTPRKRDPRSNEWVDAGATTWFEASLWDDAAESLDVRKGDKVVITGSLEAVEYDKRDGTKGFKVAVKNASVALVERGRGSNGGYSAPPAGKPAWAQEQFDSEAPF